MGSKGTRRVFQCFELTIKKCPRALQVEGLDGVPACTNKVCPLYGHPCMGYFAHVTERTQEGGE